MTEYIKKKAVLEILSSKGAAWEGYNKVMHLPIEDVIERSVFEQVIWERDVALHQLSEIGKGLGEKMNDVVKQKNGTWEVVDFEDPMRYGCSHCKSLSFRQSKYCPRCGAKMEMAW